jgi:hypothetical protein
MQCAAPTTKTCTEQQVLHCTHPAFAVRRPQTYLCCALMVASSDRNVDSSASLAVSSSSDRVWQGKGNVAIHDSWRKVL